MSDGSWLPKTWNEARPQILWGVLVLGFGLELCISLLDANYGRALLALVGLGGMTAMLIHGEQLQQRLFTVNPNWIYVSAALFLAALITSPFIEEKRWPLSAWFKARTVLVHDVVHEPALPEEVAKAALPKIAEAQTAARQAEDRARSIESELAMVQQQLTELRAQPPTPLPTDVELITTLRNNLTSVTNEKDRLAAQLTESQKALENAIPDSSPAWQLFTQLSNAFDQAELRWQELRNFASQYGQEHPSPPFGYFVPNCKIVLSAGADSGLVNMIRRAARRCEIDQAAPPPESRQVIDADITQPSPPSYPIVRFPPPEVLENQPDELPILLHGSQHPSPEVNGHAASIIGQVADNLAAALRTCGLNGQRSHKDEGFFNQRREKWAIYIDLGTAKLCR